MSVTLQLLTDKVTIEADSSDESLVTIYNVELEDLVGQLNSRELLQAIADKSDFSTIADWVSGELKDE